MAQVPDELTIQGMLFQPDGTLAPPGTYDLKIRLFKEEKEGSHAFETTVTGVVVTRALYNVSIQGDGGTLLADHLAAGARFLEWEITAGPALVGLILSPRQPLASVPYAFEAARTQATTELAAAVPLGALLLWDQVTGCEGRSRACPCGYEVAGEFAGRPVRGVDSAGILSDVPDESGVNSGAPFGSGRFGDRLTTAETGDHDHASVTDATHRHPLGESSALRTMDANAGGPEALNADDPPVLRTGVPVLTEGAAGHNHQVEAAAGGAHYHSFRSVLFCRRQ